MNVADSRFVANEEDRERLGKGVEKRASDAIAEVRYTSRMQDEWAL